MMCSLRYCPVVVMLVVGGCADDQPSGSGEDSGAADTAATTGNDSGTSTSGMPATGTDDDVEPDSSDGQDTGPTSPCAASPEAMSDCVDAAAYQEDLEFIAELRVPGSTHWQAVQDLCADRLTELGFVVDLFDYGTGINVVGTLPAADPEAAHVLIGAHYDHIPECTGADDNATGVAAALEAARVLSQGQFDRTLTVACWDEEETGLLGSEAFANAARDQGIEIAAYYNFEMLGYATDEPDTQAIPTGFDLLFPQQLAAIEANEFRGDFLFVVHDDLAQAPADAMISHAERVGLPLVNVMLTADQKNNELFGDLQRSDHAPFWAVDYPALFITDTAEFRNARYHCLNGEDSVDDLTPAFTDLVMRTAVAAAAESLGLQMD